MHLRRHTVMLPVSAAIALLLTNCAESRVSQCNRLIQVINQGHSLVTNFDDQNAAAATQLASSLDGINQQLEAVELADEQLQEYQGRFVQVYRDLSQAFREMAEALNVANNAQPNQVDKLQQANAKAESAGKVAQRAAENADKLADEINNYCKPSQN